MLFVTITHDGEELERFVLPVLTLPSDAVHVARAIREIVETEFAGEPPDELSTTIGGMEWNLYSIALPCGAEMRWISAAPQLRPWSARRDGIAHSVYWVVRLTKARPVLVHGSTLFELIWKISG
jgi:hypothetical protein